MHWSRPHLMEVLFSPRNGLFYYHPLLLAGALGWVLLARSRPRLALACAALFATQAWISGAALAWWGGNGFGMRRMTNTLPLLALGLAALAERAWRRPALRRLALAAVVLAGLWNMALLDAKLQHGLERKVVLRPRALLAHARDFYLGGHSRFATAALWSGSCVLAAAGAQALYQRRRERRGSRARA